jgi:hypothetical protein
MNTNKIEAGFNGFAEKTFHPEAGENQKQDIQNAFFAGALQILTVIATSDAETDDDFCNLMDGMNDEVKKYFEKYIKEHG